MPRKNFVIIREIDARKSGSSLYPLVRQSNPKMTRKQFNDRLAAMCEDGYRCAGAYLDGKLVGITGFWTGTRFWCGKYIDMDNVVVDEKYRGQGIGKKMVAWIEKEARRMGCRIAVLDSYTDFHGAHRFYFREGYVILGYHFTKEL